MVKAIVNSYFSDVNGFAQRDTPEHILREIGYQHFVTRGEFNKVQKTHALEIDAFIHVCLRNNETPIDTIHLEILIGWNYKMFHTASNTDSYPELKPFQIETMLRIRHRETDSLLWPIPFCFGATVATQKELSWHMKE